MWELWSWTRRRLWLCGTLGDRRAWDPTGGKYDPPTTTTTSNPPKTQQTQTFFFFRYYLDNCKAVVFVVDSSDPNRMPEAQKALKKVLGDEKLQGIPLMVLANKKDLPNSMTIREVRNTVHMTHDPPRTRLIKIMMFHIKEQTNQELECKISHSVHIKGARNVLVRRQRQRSFLVEGQH